MLVRGRILCHLREGGRMVGVALLLWVSTLELYRGISGKKRRFSNSGSRGKVEEVTASSRLMRLGLRLDLSGCGGFYECIITRSTGFMSVLVGYWTKMKEVILRFCDFRNQASSRIIPLKVSINCVNNLLCRELVTHLYRFTNTRVVSACRLATSSRVRRVFPQLSMIVYDMGLTAIPLSTCDST